MNILLASSEIVPFAKTGGLADVGAALPRALKQLGHSPVAIMPAYRQALNCGQSVRDTGIEFEVSLGSRRVPGRLLRSQLVGDDVPVYLVAQDEYFDRAHLYGDEQGDYRDNCERFVFFSRAVMQAIPKLGTPIDVVHCNDWQTGLIPALLQVEYADRPGYEQIASLFTLHNLAYQGNFWHWDMVLTGLDWKYFNWQQMEFHGHLNLLKTGIVFADALTTVSPRYSLEIQGEPLGCGLASVLQHRQSALTGILNGVDYGIWDPATDPLIAAHYQAAQWRDGKAQCKCALQRDLELPVDADVPLIGLIGRLADQKGWDLVAEVMQAWVEDRDVQWAILGTGDRKYHDLLQQLGDRYPSKVAARLEFSDALAHRIESGADMFVMASRYEPCGLNQLYSLKYGSVPVVHYTGGLADTITDCGAGDPIEPTANGFSFDRYDAQHLELTLDRAVRLFQHHPQRWDQLVRQGMSQDWSWQRSARQYLERYAQVIVQQGGTPSWNR